MTQKYKYQSLGKNKLAAAMMKKIKRDEEKQGGGGALEEEGGKWSEADDDNAGLVLLPARYQSEKSDDVVLVARCYRNQPLAFQPPPDW